MVARDVSEPWTKVTQFTRLNEKAPGGFLRSGEGLTKILATTSGPECHLQLNEEKKQQWAIEEPKLDNGRTLRGIYFIDPDDMEFKETITHAWKHWNLPMEAALPCKLKTYQYRENCGESDKHRGSPRIYEAPRNER